MPVVNYFFQKKTRLANNHPMEHAMQHSSYSGMPDTCTRILIFITLHRRPSTIWTIPWMC